MTATAALDQDPLRSLAELDTTGRLVRTITVARGWAVFSVVCGVAYALLGIWTISRSGYMIGDAAYRVANARVILFSRDPHLAAIGMTWMPLSTLATLPFTAVLQPFGLAWAAGSVMTACFGAGTVWKIVQLAHLVDASAVTTVVSVGLFVCNPVTVFWFGSAMMEAPALFFLTWACVAWVRWLRTDRVTDLAMVGVALGLGVLSRYEQFVVTMVFVGLVLLATPRARRAASAAMVVVPSVVVLVVWCSINFVIRGSFLAFLSPGPTTGAASSAGEACGFVPISLRVPERGIYGWCQVDLSVWKGIEFGLQRILRFAPVVLIGAPLLVVADLRRRLRRSPVLAVTVATLSGPGFVTFLTYLERTSGNPRYFLAAIVLPPMLCLIVADGAHRYGRAWFPLLAVTALLGVVTSVQMELNMLYAGVEHEETALSRLTGLDAHLIEGQQDLAGDNVTAWRASAARLDELTSRGDLIALDSSAAFPILLFSDHLDRFAIPEDRDFEQLLSLTDTRFTGMVITGSEKSATGVDLRLSTLAAGSVGGRAFVKVADLPGLGELLLLERADTGP